MKISIHTPTKGATWNNSTHTYTVTAISIHTPTKGATCLNIYKPRKDVNFNPHSHEGSDLLLFRHLKAGSISIHTPTKGATVYPERTDGNMGISIHTPTKGAT